MQDAKDDEEEQGEEQTEQNDNGEDYENKSMGKPKYSDGK